MRSSSSQSVEIDRLSETQSSKGKGRTSIGLGLGSGLISRVSRGLRGFDFLRPDFDRLCADDRCPDGFLPGTGVVGSESSLGGVTRILGLRIELPVDKVLWMLETDWIVTLGLLLLSGVAIAMVGV